MNDEILNYIKTSIENIEQIRTDNNYISDYTEGRLEAFEDFLYVIFKKSIICNKDKFNKVTIEFKDI